MRLTNDTYLMAIGTERWTEQYYRDKDGWVKVSTRGRRYRATAEQVLNHVLPALAGVKPARSKSSTTRAECVPRRRNRAGGATAWGGWTDRASRRWRGCTGCCESTRFG